MNKLQKTYFVLKDYGLKPTIKITLKYHKYTINQLYEFVLETAKNLLIETIKNSFSHHCIPLNKKQAEKFIKDLNLSEYEIITLANKYHKTKTKVSNYLDKKQYQIIKSKNK